MTLAGRVAGLWRYPVKSMAPLPEGDAPPPGEPFGPVDVIG
jgi:hypothetical protein